MMGNDSKILNALSLDGMASSHQSMHRFFPNRVSAAILGLPLSAALFAPAPMYALNRGVFARSPQMAPAQPGSAPVPVERRPRPKGVHLEEWLNRHSNLTPEQQRQALANEPGFKELPAQTQQRFLERLAQLDAMTPVERARLLEHNEAMERLTPAQRAQLDAAIRQLGALPPDQRRYVARTFRGLRELAPAQRQAVLNSDRFNHLTEAQRASLNSLLQVEPLMPPPYDANDGTQPLKQKTQ